MLIYVGISADIQYSGIDTEICGVSLTLMLEFECNVVLIHTRLESMIIFKLLLWLYFFVHMYSVCKSVCTATYL